MFKKHIFLVFIFVFGLYACGERGAVSNGKKTETGKTQTQGTEETASNEEQKEKPKPDAGAEEITANMETGVIAQAVKKLEKEGKYPVLDRSGTLLGTDANNNGIRDDIENYIQSLPLDNNQKSALMQNAYVENMILSPDFNYKSEEEFLKYIRMYGLSMNCGRKYLGDDYWNYFQTINAFTFNTRKRLERTMQVDDTAGNVGSWSLPMEDGCDEKFFDK